MKHRLSTAILFILALNIMFASVSVDPAPVLKNETVELVDSENQPWPQETEYLKALEKLRETRSRYGVPKRQLDGKQSEIEEEFKEQMDARLQEIERAFVEKKGEWKLFISHFQPGMRLMKITLDGGIYYHLVMGDEIIARFIERRPPDPRVL